jgi:hypothetical protein
MPAYYGEKACQVVPRKPRETPFAQELLQPRPDRRVGHAGVDPFIPFPTCAHDVHILTGGELRQEGRLDRAAKARPIGGWSKSFSRSWESKRRKGALSRRSGPVPGAF